MKIIDSYTIEIETFFYAPLLKNILQAPWLLCRWDNNIIQNINFIINRSSDKRLKLLSNCRVDVTWPSNGRAEEGKMQFRNYKFYNFSGNNIFTLKSENKSFIDLINCLKDDIQREVKSQIKSQVDSEKSFIKDISIRTQQISINHNQHYKKKYTLGYLNYYPNKEICRIIKEVLYQYADIELCNLGLIEQNIKKKVDGNLIILSPLFFSKYSIALAMLADLRNSNKREIIKEIYSLDGEKLSIQMQECYHYIPLFSSRNIFWQKKSIEDCFFDNFGRINRNCL